MSFDAAQLKESFGGKRLPGFGRAFFSLKKSIDVCVSGNT
jgi:hypothetical protein